MRKIFLLCCLVSLTFQLLGQEPYRITGTVTDTTNYTATQYTSAALLRASDSVLVMATRVDEHGQFSLQTDTPGSYILLFEHPRFASYTTGVVVNQPRIALGNIPLISRQQLLAEVIVSGQQAITIKGDTIEFNADSFQVRQYDNVDELLKRLPGLEISSDGTIKAYGQRVEKMFVDGEEFFSDDPAVVAKTLRASSVDKVQVFDKQSEQAEFTGIDDGERIKTINLQLKEDAKQGYFGKASIGGGLPAYWENQAMINAFKKKRKISAFGTMSNTDQPGLSWNDAQQFGSGGGLSIGGGGVSMAGIAAFSGMQTAYGAQGTPRTWSGGTHYSNKWWDEALAFNGSYNYNKHITEGFNNYVSQYILPDTQYFNAANSQNDRISQRHNLYVNSTYEIDSLSSLRASVSGSYRLGRSEQYQQSVSRTSTGSTINDNTQQNYSEDEGKDINASLLYRKRFKKKGRTLSARIAGEWQSTVRDGFQLSDFHLYVVDSAQHIRQRKHSESTNMGLESELTYTEPLSQKTYLTFRYQFRADNRESNRQSFDIPKGLELDDGGALNPLYSSHYEFNTLANSGGVNLRYNPNDKINVSVGTDVVRTDYNQTDKMNDTSYRYSYLNLFPRLAFTYNKSHSGSLRISYNGRSRQPSLNQIQPLRDNEDPLNIAIGNPNLKQEFSHTVRGSYNSYKVLTGRSFSLSGNLTLIQNAISQMQHVDISGRRTYQYVNVNGNYHSSLYAHYGRKIVSNLRGDVHLNTSYSHRNGYINGLANTTKNLSLSPGIGIFYRKDTTLNMAYSFNPSYNNNASTIRSDVKTRYWILSQRLDFRLFLPYRIEVGTTIDWNVRQRLHEQDKNNNVFLWNAYVSRSFLKDRSLVLKLYGNDLVNQNIGYTRYETAQEITENTYNTIQRYVMLSLTWNFTKTAATSAPSSPTSNEN